MNTDHGAPKDIPIPLQSGGTAVLQLPYLLDERDYTWLTDLLKGLKSSMVTNRQPQGSAEPELEEPSTPEGDEGEAAVCERHDAAVAAGMELHPKTGECEGPGD